MEICVALPVGEPAPANLGSKLWLGSATHAESPQWLSAAGVSLVIDCRVDGDDIYNLQVDGNPV